MPRIRFEDHASFQTGTVRLVIGGAAGALAALAGRTLLGPEHAYSMIMGCMGVGMGIALMWGRRWPALLVLGPLLGLGSVALLLAAGDSHEPFGLGLMGAVLGLPLALPSGSRLRAALVIAGTALGAVVGIASVRAVEATLLGPIDAPDIASYALQGGIVGLFVSIGTVGRHITVAGDAVQDALARATRDLPGDFAELVGRAGETRVRVLDALERRADGSEKERAQVRKAVDELAGCIVKVGRRWQAVDTDLGTTSPAVLERRIAELTGRIEAAADPEARAAYEKARGALEDQLQHRTEIAKSRDRTVARLHSYLAVLERLHLAVVRFRSSDAHRFATEMQPMLDELDGVGTDAELAAQAIDESQRSSTTSA
ncbi:MAG: hypothetical protein HYY06_03915 [Deltaproteobacteria bacterium]|nr:hypothetical protein [Deltaproteobacteria bacterium]